MSLPLTRRQVVTGALALAGLGDFGFLTHLPRIHAADDVSGVHLEPDIEPLVRLVEDTPQEKILEFAADQIGRGASYQRLLSAVFLAGIRTIQPRPVGFEFHCVLAVHSAHQAALAAPDGDRWLALFWALDTFKQSQAVKKRKGPWVMPKLEEAKLPPASKARQEFIAAMDDWDEERADRAIAVLARSAGAGEVFELLVRYGARDLRDIGHKAIYVANGYRTLQTIGWRHAEPVLRSIVFALLDHEAGNPAKDEREPDRPWRENVGRSSKVRPGWNRGTANPAAAVDLLAATRSASRADVCDRALELLNRNIDPSSVWDGLFLSAGEGLMRQPGIVALHCCTTMNALHYAYQTSGNDETRRMLLLQGAAFAAYFRGRLGKPGQQGPEIEKLERFSPSSSGPAAIEEIFADVSKDRSTAARKAFALVQTDHHAATSLLAAGRRLVFNKGRDSHDYKFSSAAIEDFHHVSPAWRPQYLASSLYWLHGAGDRDNDLIPRARAALAKS